MNHFLQSELSSEELARRARAGSSDAFEALVERFGPGLLSHLRRLTRREQDAEDIRQETFLRAYQNLHRYDPGRPFGAWLFTIATRLAASHARGRQAPAALADDPVSPDVSETAQAAEESRRLWQTARRQLSPRAYQVLYMRYVDGLAVKEIARRTGLTGIHVKVLLHRARRKLGKELTAEDAEREES